MKKGLHKFLMRFLCVLLSALMLSLASINSFAIAEAIKPIYIKDVKLIYAESRLNLPCKVLKIGFHIKASYSTEAVLTEGLYIRKAKQLRKATDLEEFRSITQNILLQIENKKALP